VLLLLGSGLACEPIPAPAVENPRPTSSRIEVGDHLPEFLLEDQAGNTVTPASLLGAVATLTFVVPDAAPPEALLRRIDDVYDRLGADAIRVVRYLVTLPAPGGASSLVERDGWTSLRGNAEAVTDLAARFGVVTWLGPDAEPVQTLAVAIIGPGGVVTARFAGLETWEGMDMLVAIVEAGR
jgi:cytochrome oxidase Cu insertion factor (SCO1/SenC/PrrC family)